MTAVGSTRTEGHAIPVQGAASARVEVEMDSGELRLGRGAGRLVDAAFTYNVDDWQPEIDYRVISREGVLHLEQDDGDGPFPLLYRDTVNVWDLVLTPDIPVNLALDLGSSDATLALGGLDLLGLDFSGDGGDAIVDLDGPLARDLDVRLATGGGNVTLTVPADAGVRVAVDADGGTVEAAGFRTTGPAFVNDRYGATPRTLTVTVETDGGEVTLLQATPPTAETSPIVEVGP